MNETNITQAPSSGLTMASLQDPDANVAANFYSSLGLIFVGIMGIFGNIASIKVLSHKSMRSSVNFILIALASSDLVLILTAILLFGLSTFYPFNGTLIDYYFIWQPHITLVAYPLGIIAQTISIYMTFLISLERYIAVCHPLQAKSFCTQSRTKMSILMTVVVSIAYNFTKFFEVNLLQGYDENYGAFYFAGPSKLRVNPLYIEIYIHWMYLIFMLAIPLSGITFFNLRIWHQVQVVNKMRTKLTSKERQDIKLTTMLFSVVIVFLICNFPAVLTNVLEFFTIHNDLLTRISNFLVTLNSSVNFIIYVVLVKKFRQIFFKEFKVFFICGDGNLNMRKFSRQKTISSSYSDENQTTNETLLN